MTAFGTFIATVCACEAFLMLTSSRTMRTNRTAVSSVGRILRSSTISDHWKEQALPRYAIRMSVSSLLILIYTLLAVVPFFVLILFRPEIWQTLNNVFGLIAITAVALGYVVLRKLRSR